MRIKSILIFSVILLIPFAFPYDSIGLEQIGFQKPSEFKQNSPERSLAEYISAWKNKNWQRMAKFTQPSWIGHEGGKANTLKYDYESQDIKGFKLENVERFGPGMVAITYLLKYKRGSVEAIARVKASLLCEIPPSNRPCGTVLGKNKWGVNPNSTSNWKIVSKEILF